LRGVLADCGGRVTSRRLKRWAVTAAAACAPSALLWLGGCDADELFARGPGLVGLIVGTLLSVVAIRSALDLAD
jgi:hypothetical protein